MGGWLQALLYDFQTKHDLWLLSIPIWLVTNKYHNKQSMGFLLSEFSKLVHTVSLVCFQDFPHCQLSGESHSCCPVHHLLGTVAGALSSSFSPMLLLIANIASSILVIAASKLSSILRILSVVTSISDNQARMLGRDEGFNRYSKKIQINHDDDT